MCDKPHLNPCGIPQLDIGRDVNGRFRKGNPGGPGNPFARKVAALRKELLDMISVQTLREIVAMLEQKAKSGDLAAVKILFQYGLGKPEPVKDPDRMDVDEWQRLQELRVSEKQFDRTIEDMPACLACHQAQSFWPNTAQDGPPLASAIHHVRSQMQPSANGNQPLPPNPDHCTSKSDMAAPDAAPDAALPAPAAPANEPAVPAAQEAVRPSSSSASANGQSKPDGRREPKTRAVAGRSNGSNGHSPTPRPPSPNEEIGEQDEREALRTAEYLRRLWQPPQSEQTQRDTSPN